MSFLSAYIFYKTFKLYYFYLLVIAKKKSFKMRLLTIALSAALLFFIGILFFPAWLNMQINAFPPNRKNLDFIFIYNGILYFVGIMRGINQAEKECKALSTSL